MLIAVQRPVLSGNMGFYGGKDRSPSLCSLDDGSQLECLLEEADKIGAAKNGLGKDVRHKKQVRFDMERNEQFYYSYMVSSDDDSGKFDMEHHVNYVNYEHLNGNYDSYDDDDDEEEEEFYEEDEEEESEAENSEIDATHGQLVNKSSAIQNGYSEHHDNSVGGVGRQTQEDDDEQFPAAHDDTYSTGFAKEKASHSGSAGIARQTSVNREISDLGEQLRIAREDAKREMDRLQEELENRRKEYLTEMTEFDKNRAEQTKKFEEELQEFRNEKTLVERRERYREHELLIAQQEMELIQRKEQALEQEKEIRDYEEYLNRRHNVLNGKEADLNTLQSELDCLAQELESRKERLEEKLKQHNDDDDDAVVSPAPAYARQRSASRVSSLGRGLDLRVEELKAQNRQILEELFALRKACDNKDEEIAELRSKLEGSENENKWLQQKVKHLDTHLGLARKTAELGSESLSPSVEEIMQRTSVDIRNARGLRPTLRSHRVSVPCGSSSISSHPRLPRQASDDSLGTKASTSTSSGAKETNMRSSKNSRNGTGPSPGTGRQKLGREHTISSLCSVM